MEDAATAKDQFAICTKECGARCCRYVTVDIATPRGENDWDEIRWWLAHEGTMVTKDEDGWMLHVRTPCRHLRPDNACSIYPRHMTTCREYDPEHCEFTGEVPYEVQLHRETDLADYLERRGLKRGARVARAIREAGRDPLPSPLVPLVGLDGV